MRKLFVLLLGLLPIGGIAAESSERKQAHLQCLVDAYPEFIDFTDASRHAIASKQGDPYPYEPQRQYENYNAELDSADLYSQLREPYVPGQLPDSPTRNVDPGRLRYTPLFEDMYGKSRAEVSRNLTVVRWKPCDCNVSFSRVNGAAQALETAGQQIFEAGLSSYVEKSLGTFNWRRIAGTERLSMHSFGIAIDFALPNKLGRYWRWDKKGATRTFPKEILLDPKLNQVVDIFERNGFIWGGKWWHYDSIHFEYRPELTIYGCSNL